MNAEYVEINKPNDGCWDDDFVGLISSRYGGFCLFAVGLNLQLHM
jgi:hypothetical protein